MMDDRALVQRFVLDYLRDLGATIEDKEGVHTVDFPAGKKRRFGRVRSFTFDPEKRREGVELVEAGSPFLKSLLTEAKTTGAVAAYPTAAFPPATRIYVFQFEAYSSVKKRSGFAWAELDATSGRVRLHDGFPDFLEEPVGHLQGRPEEVAFLREGFALVEGGVEERGRVFSQEAVKESHEGFRQALTRVDQYFQGMHQDTFLEEARIRKRLGEIQSKLYFTEDGLRELKLQKEAERLTTELHTIKKQNMERGTTLETDRARHEETARRRHEPKLRVRLLAALVARPPELGVRTP